jgi:DNA-directed RNA polymerase sigma subunit (sigma70/sigma32)
MASKVKENEEADSERDGATDGPLLDLSDDAVKKMIKAAKKRGYVTMDELNSVLPSEEVTSEQIEDTMAMLSDMGINVIEDEDAEEAAPAEDSDDDSDGDGEGSELAPSQGTQLATAKKKEPTDRTDDPVRMYLREMGSVELLSREGEIAIAKRIEAGRETMISGLCESPLTFQALIIWRDELNEGTTLLREIIDLETTYSGPEAKAAPQFQSPEKIEADRKAAEEKEKTRRARAPSGDDDITDVGGDGAPPEEEEEDEDESNLSLAAMEAELRPQVMETLDTIADTYKKLRKLQDQQVEARLACAGTLSSGQERRYKELKDQLITAVKSLSLNQNRIDSLVEQLYDINKRLVQNEGKLLRLAESYGVKRDSFLEQYQGAELDPNWMKSIGNLSARGWKDFAREENQTIRDIRGEIQNLATETGISVTEFRRIVHMVQKGEREARIAKKEMVEANLRLVTPLPRSTRTGPAVPRSHSGRQYRPDEGGRQIRVSPRLQVLDLCDLVDPAGDHPFDRRPGPDDPHSGAHDRDDQQDRPYLAPDAARDRSRADAGRTGRKARHAARKGPQGPEDRQGTDLARNPRGRRRGQPSRRLHRGQERASADRRGHPGEPARNHDPRSRLAHPARGTRAAHALRHRHEHRPHAGRSRPAVQRDARTHPPDRSQGAAQAEASVKVAEAAELPG